MFTQPEAEPRKGNSMTTPIVNESAMTPRPLTPANEIIRIPKELVTARVVKRTSNSDRKLRENVETKAKANGLPLPQRRSTATALSGQTRLIGLHLYDRGYDTEHLVLEKTTPRRYEYVGSIREIAARCDTDTRTVRNSLRDLAHVGVITYMERIDSGQGQEANDDDDPTTEHDYRFGRPSRKKAPKNATIRIELMSPALGPDEGDEGPYEEITYSKQGYVSIPSAAFWEFRRYGVLRNSLSKDAPSEDIREARADRVHALSAILTVMVRGDHSAGAMNRCADGTKKLAKFAGTNVATFTKWTEAAGRLYPGVFRKVQIVAKDRSEHYFGPTVYFVDWDKMAILMSGADLGAVTPLLFDDGRSEDGNDLVEQVRVEPLLEASAS